MNIGGFKKNKILHVLDYICVKFYSKIYILTETTIKMKTKKKT